MINLIPKEEKKKITRGFYCRLLILFLLAGSFSIIIVLVAILPSYFFSSTQNSIINTKLEIQKNELAPLPDQQTLAIIKDLNNKLSLIERAENNKFLISKKVINAIISEKILGIKITDISYENDPLKGKKISIQGNAPSREVLLSFRLALENNNLFRQIDLPISNFVKGSNIQFYLSLIPS